MTHRTVVYELLGPPVSVIVLVVVLVVLVILAEGNVVPATDTVVSVQ